MPDVLQILIDLFQSVAIIMLAFGSPWVNND